MASLPQGGAAAPSSTASAAATAPAASAGAAGGAPRVHGAMHFVAGAAGGAIAATLLSPLDIVRTRLQSSRGHHLHVGATRMLGGIVRREGFLALWRGLVPTIFGVGPARSLYFGSYAVAKRRLGAEGAGLSGVPLHLTGSALAGVISNTIMSPWWVIRLRLQLQQTPIVPFWRRALPGLLPPPAPLAAVAALAPGAPAAYTGVWDAARRIYAEEGWRAFYRGLSASYLGVVETVLQFTIYGELKRMLHESAAASAAAAAPARAGEPPAPPPTLRSLLGGQSWAFGMSAAAKLLASTLTYPHEVLRTRMREEVVAVGAANKYRGLLQSTRLIIAEEGVAGLYGGMGVHLLRTVPNAAILLWVVETMVGGEV